MNFWTLLLFLRYSLGNIILACLIPFSTFLKKRRDFESLWSLERLTSLDFDAIFHVSSEGELEQVLPWVECKIYRKEKVLVLFTSPSLINRATQLNDPSRGLSFAALGLLCFSPWSKKNVLSLKVPPEFFMVRYDFFPELIFIANKVVKKSGKSTLLAATLKGKRHFLENKFFRLILKSTYRAFKTIYTSTERDKVDLLKLMEGEDITIDSLDFRHGQILKRQSLKTNLFDQEIFRNFEIFIEEYPWNNRLIFGNLWSNELLLFSEKFLRFIKDENLFVFLAPHKLKGDDWGEITSFLKNFERVGIETAIWKKDSLWKDLKDSQVILCQIPGLLCELYPYFAHCFVGGGHGRSVHSLLEPYWGGGHVYFGPKTHRSTEFDFVWDESPKQVHVVRELDKFYDKLKRNINVPVDRNLREQLAKKLLAKQERVL